MKKYRPLADKALVRRHEQSVFAQTSSGERSNLILAPEDQINKSIYCTVVAAGKITGPGGRTDSEVSPGDVVVLRQWSGDQIDALKDPMLLSVHQQLIEAVREGIKPDPIAMELVERFEKANNNVVQMFPGGMHA